MQKTALAELIRKLETTYRQNKINAGDYGSGILDGLGMAISDAKELLEKEKTQIANSFINGWNNHDKWIKEDKSCIENEDFYFNNTYTQK